MTTFNNDDAKYEKRKVADLQNWEDNPRLIQKPEEFDRLKDQIKHLGVYKPLLINQQNIVLGGNMRLRAFRELGIEEVMCAVVLTDNRAQMLEYALSDNDSAGVTDVEKVQEMAVLEPSVRSELFAIHSRPATLVSKLKKRVSPDPEGQDDPGEEKCRHCPHHCPEEDEA